MNKELIMLMILDGFGISNYEEGNAIKNANNFIDALKASVDNNS